MHRLLHGLIDGFGRQSERRADAGRSRRAQMGDVVDLVLVQADALHEIDLNLVSGSQTAHQRRAVKAALLRNREHGRDVVAGMRIVGGEERVVHVEFAHRDAVGPGRPFRRQATVLRIGRTRSRQAGTGGRSPASAR